MQAPLLVLRYVTPSWVSIDGRDEMPVVFRTVMLPWMLQSPLFPNIAVLIASVAQAVEIGSESRYKTEPLAMKVKVLGMINKVLGTDHDMTDILRSIIHLVVIEVSYPSTWVIPLLTLFLCCTILNLQWFWGDDNSMYAHLCGLRDLVKIRGGFGSLNDPLFAAVLMLYVPLQRGFFLGYCGLIEPTKLTIKRHAKVPTTPSRVAARGTSACRSEQLPHTSRPRRQTCMATCSSAR